MFMRISTISESLYFISTIVLIMIIHLFWLIFIKKINLLCLVSNNYFFILRFLIRHFILFVAFYFLLSLLCMSKSRSIVCVYTFFNRIICILQIRYICMIQIMRQNTIQSHIQYICKLQSILKNIN